MYNQCTLNITQSIKLPLHFSVYTAFGYQCPLKMNFNQLPAWCMIGRKKISISVQTDFRKLVNWCICSHWFSKTGVHWKRTGVHWTLTSQWNQCTPVFENQCICSNSFSKNGVHWKQSGLHWKLSRQPNQCTLILFQCTPKKSRIVQATEKLTFKFYLRLCLLGLTNGHALIYVL